MFAGRYCGRMRRGGRMGDYWLPSSSRRDDTALESLVRRHGPMVFGVCRRVVRNHHDAEDAFQATFLVLARKASSVKPRQMVANWLHGVAYRTAMKAMTRTAKLRMREKHVLEMPEPEVSPKEP